MTNRTVYVVSVRCGKGNLVSLLLCLRSASLPRSLGVGRLFICIHVSVETLSRCLLVPMCSSEESVPVFLCLFSLFAHVTHDPRLVFAFVGRQGLCTRARSCPRLARPHNTIILVSTRRKALSLWSLSRGGNYSNDILALPSVMYRTRLSPSIHLQAVCGKY